MYATWFDYCTVTDMQTKKEVLKYAVPVMAVGEPAWMYMNSPRQGAVARVAGWNGNLDGARTTRNGAARPALYQEGIPE